MARPLHRGVSADNLSSKPFSENGFMSDPFSPGPMRSRHKVTLTLLKFSLVVIVILALTGSFWWTLSITSTTRGQIFRGYRRLQEQLVSDLYEIGELSLGTSRFKELEYCSQESENYVPCFNVSENLALGFSDGEEHDRHCIHGLKHNCLVLPPVNYRIPLRWPTGKDVIWFANVNITAQEVLSSGSLTKRSDFFPFISSKFDVEDYSHQIAEIIGLRNVSYFSQAGVRTILDIECGYGSFGAHLSSHQLLTMCLANYEASGSQVQLTLERDGIFLVEVDRLLRPGGYFVWTDPLINSQRSLRDKVNLKKWNAVSSFTEKLCWDMLPQQEETVVWKKTSKKKCYSSRKAGSPSLCSKGHDIESPYYRPLQSCIGGTQSHRWVPIEERRKWPSLAKLNSAELAIHGLHSEEFADDAINWNSAVRNYWSLLSPLIFSDHPKRPGDEDPSPPYNMLRNVLDMNARFGGFNAALLETGKSAWVMNVPTRGRNTLPLILDRGFVGVLHDWCEPFPTYPRTYDLVHAEGLLSLEFAEQPRCQMLDLFAEIDRILRPELIKHANAGVGDSKGHCSSLSLQDLTAEMAHEL
ncbi:UNVERIFIED_CONTAM: putative pectin methyltransferase QUA2 [Sesamum angustifolium]|uniref:Methyltransferase n=1 Tax=Sesamum angustifolium TaxID=2727405 RepID=A0AAW2LWS3_9LAMI